MLLSARLAQRCPVAGVGSWVGGVQHVQRAFDLAPKRANNVSVAGRSVSVNGGDAGRRTSVNVMRIIAITNNVPNAAGPHGTVDIGASIECATHRASSATA